MRRQLHSILLRAGLFFLSSSGLLALAPFGGAQGLSSGDLSRLRSVGSVELSPDGRRIAYTVTMRDRPGRPYGQLWIMDVATQNSVRVGSEKDSGGGPLWSPDGKWFAFISSTPGPEAAEAAGDPMVITRYLYKPDAGEGMTRFNDNQRLHIFVVDIVTKQIRQLTKGDTDEHSIDWSPDGKEILYLTNPEPNQDEFFNYDVFALRVADNSVRRITATEFNEYDPLWSPDGKRILFRGTRRGLTDRETTLEDTHVWVMNADGSARREIGALIDNRQGSPRWAADGNSVYFTVQERGSNYLVRLPVSAGKPEYVVKEPGSVGAFSIGKDGTVAYSYASPRDFNELYLKTGNAAPRKLTDLNAQLLAGKQIAEVESFTLISNDNKFEVEAFLTK